MAVISRLGPEPAGHRAAETVPPAALRNPAAAMLDLQRAAGNAAPTRALRSGAPGGASRRLARAVAARREAAASTDVTRLLARDEAACATRCGILAGCPPPLCCPFPFGPATYVCDRIREPFLAAIAVKVSPRVVP